MITVISFWLIGAQSMSAPSNSLDPTSIFNYVRGLSDKGSEEQESLLRGRESLNRQFVQLVFSDIIDVSHVLIEETHSDRLTVREKLDLMRIAMTYQHHTTFYPILYRAIWQRTRASEDRALIVNEIISIIDSDKTAPSRAWAHVVRDLKSPALTQAFKRMVLRKPIGLYWAFYVEVITEQDPAARESLKRHAERHAELLLRPFNN